MQEAQFQRRLAELREVQEYHSAQDLIEKVKEGIAIAASKLLEAPEENLSQLRLLLELCLDDRGEVLSSKFGQALWSAQAVAVGAYPCLHCACMCSCLSCCVAH